MVLVLVSCATKTVLGTMTNKLAKHAKSANRAMLPILSKTLKLLIF